MMKALHRGIWQRLPYALRRAALFRATSRIAPRADATAAPAAPLFVAGTFRTASGLGESARLSLAALRAAGVAAGALDLTRTFRQPATLPPPEEGPAMPAGPGTLLLHVNSPLTGMALLAIGRHLTRGKRIIGYWAWELPEVTPEWQLGVELVHEIWVPSRFTAAALAPLAAGKPLRVVPHPVALAPPPPRPRGAPGRPFTVLTIFDATSSLARKNPEGAIEAFRRAFGADRNARLIVKTREMGMADGQRSRLAALADAPNIDVIDATLTPDELEMLYAEADVLLSLHRAEGFGLTLAEAMCRGLPVVATGWSGNADFLTERTGVPVPWQLVAAEDPQRTYHHPHLRWAEPELDAAAAALVALRDDPDRRARLGAAAAAHAAANWSAAAYHAHLREAGVAI